MHDEKPFPFFSDKFTIKFKTIKVVFIGDLEE